MRTPEELFKDPSASTWLKNALRTALKRDAIDARNDADVLAQILDTRAIDALDASPKTKADRQYPLKVEPYITACRLEPTGFTETPAAILEWASNVVRHIRRALKGTNIHVVLWTYRYGAHQYLALDFTDDLDRYYSLTFCPGGPHDYRTHELTVPDFAEAIHMTGILLQILRPTVEVGARSEHSSQTPRRKAP